MPKKWFLNTNKKLWFTGGGTFGHIRPLLSIYQVLKNEFPSMQIEACFIQAKRDIRFPIPLRKEFHNYFLSMEGMPRNKNIVNWLRFLFLLGTSFIRVLMIFLSHRPHFILSTGGFVSFPVLLLARLTHIPYLILEPNSTRGVVTRFFQKHSTRVYVTKIFEEEKNDKIRMMPYFHYFPPVTREAARTFLGIPETSKPIIGIFGGSQGSEGLNRLILDSLALWQEQFLIVWIGGKQYLSLQEKLQERKEFGSIILLDFVSQMENFYTSIDLCISRAGASTIGEILYYQKPVIFVPLPSSAEDHQRKNAHKACEYMQGVVLEETEPVISVELVKSLLTHQENRSPQEDANPFEPIIQDIEEILHLQHKKEERKA